MAVSMNAVDVVVALLAYKTNINFKDKVSICIEGSALVGIIRLHIIFNHIVREVPSLFVRLRTALC